MIFFVCGCIFFFIFSSWGLSIFSLVLLIYWQFVIVFEVSWFPFRFLDCNLVFGGLFYFELGFCGWTVRLMLLWQVKCAKMLSFLNVCSLCFRACIVCCITGILLPRTLRLASDPLKMHYFWRICHALNENFEESEQLMATKQFFFFFWNTICAFGLALEEFVEDNMFFGCYFYG